MLTRAAIVLAWAGLGLWGTEGCGGFLDPMTVRGTGGATDAGGGNGGGGGDGGSSGSNALAGKNTTGGAGCAAECVLQPNDQK